MAIDANNLTTKQAAFLGNLLTSPTVTEAAQKSKVSRMAVSRWMKLPHFRSALRDIRRQVIDNATISLAHVGQQAVATLYRNLNCGDPRVEVTAAVAILERIGALITEQDIEERLSAVESTLAAKATP